MTEKDKEIATDSVVKLKELLESETAEIQENEREVLGNAVGILDRLRL